jgi:hypothetical protein
VPVNSTHPDYDACALDWSRARDVLSGEDAVKAAGEKYLPRLDSQTDEEFAAYRKRASFFNATARTADGYVGLMFRRPPFVKVPEGSAGVGRALADFVNDADMLGTTLAAYAKSVIWEVMGVGRAGSLVDWEGQVEKRAYVSLYSAEQIINWRVERVNGRNVSTLVVLRESAIAKPGPDDDGFELKLVEQVRVLKLEVGETANPTGGTSRTSQTGGTAERRCVVEIWQPKDLPRGGNQRRTKVEWQLVEKTIPLRLGKPLPLIPFVFHGPRHSRSDVDRLPLSDMIAVNLDHYRLDADFKHGLHFTALPTAWVSGFDKTATLRIGSSTAWVSETPGATAGYLEFTGQGLTTFERAMDRDERLMAVLGSRLLEDQKKVGETAQAIELRQSGENSVLSSVATSVSESLTQVLRWVYWWNSTEATPEAVTSGEVLIQLNTDFSTKGMDSLEIQAVVAAWQNGAISRDTMFELFRKGEILPDGRTNADELELIGAGNPKPGQGAPNTTPPAQARGSKVDGGEQQQQQTVG